MIFIFEHWAVSDLDLLQNLGISVTAEKGEDAHHAKGIEWVSSNCWPDSEAEGLDHFAKAQLVAAPSACVDLAAISGMPALAVGNGYGEVGISR